MRGFRCLLDHVCFPSTTNAPKDASDDRPTFAFPKDLSCHGRQSVMHEPDVSARPLLTLSVLDSTSLRAT